MQIGDRVKIARESLHITQLELSKRLSISQSALNQIEKGVTRQPRNIEKLCKVLNVNAAWLLTGESNLFEKENLSNVIETDRPLDKVKIPVLTWSQAVNFKEELRNFLMDDKTVYLTVGENQSKDCFGLKVRDDAMYNGTYRSFPPGCYIAISPDREPKLNDNVVAIVEGQDEVIFKQLIKDGANSYLRPLNPQYEKILIDEKVKIIGVVIKQEIHY
jgi:SOS-response transcriptional repressor LexA